MIRATVFRFAAFKSESAHCVVSWRAGSDNKRHYFIITKISTVFT